MPNEAEVKKYARMFAIHNSRLSPVVPREGERQVAVVHMDGHDLSNFQVYRNPTSKRHYISFFGRPIEVALEGDPTGYL